jgi:hypothetical protein
LEDKLSGRVWQYVWQYIWAGVAEFCPKEHTCYCDGYGICFGSEEQFTQFFDKRQTVRDLQKEMEEILGVEDWVESTFDKDKDDKLRTIKKKIQEIEEEMDGLKKEAIERGKDLKSRALESGREFKEGDGF